MKVTLYHADTMFPYNNDNINRNNNQAMIRKDIELNHTEIGKYLSDLNFGLNVDKSFAALEYLIDIQPNFLKKTITFDDKNLDEVYAYTHGMGKAPKDSEHFEPLTRSTNVNDILIFENEEGLKSVKRYAPRGFEKLPKALAIKVLVATGEREQAPEVTPSINSKIKKPKQ
jgi:hypothetical protein